MAIKSKTMMDHINTASMQAHDNPILSTALKVGFFTWHYFEMMLAMMFGASLFELLVRKLPAIGIQPDTFPYYGGVALSMMIVMIAWMIVRGHGWRHSAEMAVAMLVPVAFVAVVSILKSDTPLAWFNANYCSAMCVGMFVAMLYRWDHFTRWSFRSSHHGH